MVKRNITLAILFLLLLIGCSNIIENLPELKNDYVVGRIKIDIKSENKISLIGKKENRKYFVEIYYPALKNTNKAKYNTVFRPKEDIGLDFLLKSYNATLIKNNFTKLETHTYVNASPIINKKYPIILFEPGGQSS
ncbi:MAG: hypothetical protein KDK54_00005 [Leptospiraceae bacterium]|nr:hypothetical protein [Leptospiraceae bacterium]